MKLVEMILNVMRNVSKPQKIFFNKLIKTIIATFGKINFRNLARHSGLSERTFSRWFQKAFDFTEFNSKMIDQVVTKESRIMAAFDSTFAEKAGKKTWGIEYYWNGSASRTEKGLEHNLLSLVDVTTNVGYPLIVEQTPPKEEIKELLGKKEIEKSDGPTRVDFYLSIVVKAQSYIKKYTNLLAVDGFFTKKKFIDGVVDSGLHIVGKLRCDANLKVLYDGPQKKGRGRPKIFAGKCKIEDLNGFELVEALPDNEKLYVGTFYHASLERKIKVAAVTCVKAKGIGIALFFSTDLSLSAQDILLFYRSRFQIEFIFRDAKQFTGFDNCQARNKKALHYHSNASMAALNAIKVQEYLELKKLNEERSVFSMASWKARFHNESLIQTFFSMSGLDLSLIKLNPAYQMILNFGTISFRGM